MKKNLLLFILFVFIIGQAYSQVNISGKVTNISGEPIPGVNVMVKGTDMGTVTDVNGEYALGNISKDAIITFSFVGMLAEEVTVGDQAIIDMTLIEDIQSLDEVVVIGYGTTTKRDLTGAVSSVKSKEITMAPVPRRKSTKSSFIKSKILDNP